MKEVEANKIIFEALEWWNGLGLEKQTERIVGQYLAEKKKEAKK